MVTKKPIIPIIKKKVNAFLVGEEGNITKESILKAGIMLSSVALGSALASKSVTGHTSTHASAHTNDMFSPYIAEEVKGSHSHSVHSSHTSHGSHANHCSGKWCS